MIEIPPIGQWKGIELFLKVMDWRIIDHQGIPVDKKAGIPVKIQIRNIAPGDWLQVDKILTEMRETQVGFAAKHDIEGPVEMLGVKRGQRTAGGQQAIRQLCPDHFSDPEGIAAKGDHAINPNDSRLIIPNGCLNLFKSAEGAIENLRIDSSRMQLSSQIGNPEGCEEQLCRCSRPEIRINQSHSIHMPGR